MQARFRFLSLLLVATAPIAQAYIPSRVDYCNADPLSKRVADATALIIPKAYLHLNETKTAYVLTTRPFNYLVGNPTPVCPNQPYYEQVRAQQGRTGFLVGERTFMMAAHATTSVYDPDDYAILFAWRWVEDGAQTNLSPDRNCKLAIDPNNIPLDAVYHADPLAPVYNTYDGNPSNPFDYMTFQLDRPVPGVVPLPVRRSGQPLVGDPLILPGFPDTLPLKVVGGGSIQRVGPFGIGIGDVWSGIGSSGSPAFNTRAQLVEAIVARDRGAVDWKLDATGTCFEQALNTAAVGNRYNDITNGPIKDLPANMLPAPKTLQVSPLNVVRHVVTGADVSNRFSSFEVSLPAAATSPVDYTVKATSLGVSGGPAHLSPMLSIQPDSPIHTIQPGASQRFTVEVAGTSTDCELFDAEVRITPLTSGAYASAIPHRFEVAWRDYFVTPDSPWVANGFAPPYPTRELTLKNPSAVNQTIRLETSTPWLRIDGASLAQVFVPASGSATATLSILSTADLDVPPGTTAHGRVTVTPGISLCTDRARQEIDVDFTNGVTEHAVPNVAEALLPKPASGATYGAMQEYSFDLSSFAGETIADVDMSISFVPLLPSPYLLESAPSLTRIDLVVPGPAGKTPYVYTLWDGQAAPASYLTNAANNGLRMTLDDELSPPLAGTLLSAADGKDMGGTWKIRVYNRTQNDVLVGDVKLRVVRTP